MITTRQGGTLYLTINLTDIDNNPYTLESGDKIRFGVRNISGGEKMIYKELTSSDEVDGEYPLTLTPENTNIAVGRYLYDVSLQLSSGELYDIVSADYFIVKDSVTFKGDSA